MGVSRFLSRTYLRCPLAPSAVCTYLCLSQDLSACRMNVHMTWSPLTPSHDGMHMTSSLFTSARSRNRRSSYTSMDFSSLVPSRALKRPPALSSPSPSVGANSLSRLKFTLVLGVDLHVAEAFVLMQLLLSGRGVILVICSAVDGKIQGTGPLHRYGQAPAAVQTLSHCQTGKLTFQIQLRVYGSWIERCVL